MAITVNNLQSTGNDTLLYTPSSVTDSCLVVLVSSEDIDDNETITAIKFGSTTMTLEVIGSTELASAQDIAIAYLVNPGTSAETITVTGGQHDRMGVVALTLDNVDQTTPVDVSHGSFSTSTSSTVSTTATTSNDNSFIVSGVTAALDSVSLSVVGATEILEYAPPSSKTAVATSTQVTAGTYSHDYTSTATVRLPAASIAFSLAAGALDITPTGIASTEAFGTAVVTTGAVDISPTGIASAEAFGSHTVTLTQDVSPSGIASEEAFGTAVLTTGAVDISPSGIASEEAFGTADVSQATFLTPTGIVSEEAFGTAVITTGAVTVSPTGIVSAEAFGSHTIAVAGDKDIKIDFANELVLTSNLQSTTLYFNGTDYFTID